MGLGMMLFDTTKALGYGVKELGLMTARDSKFSQEINPLMP